MIGPCLTGIACLAFLCGGFWVLEYGTRRRRVMGIDVEQREDRISQLPDEVILLIVSRLHMRGAIRTSVLSRRWKHVYTFISEVRFYCYTMFSDSPPRYNLKGEKLERISKKVCPSSGYLLTTSFWF